MDIIIYPFYAFLTSFGFGIIFNIKGKNLFFSALDGGLGWFVYLLCIKCGSSDNLAYFSAAIFISAFAEVLARKLKTPVTLFLVCALIPLVPGSGMYYTMFECVNGNISESLKIGFKTICIAGAIATGIILVSCTTKIITSKVSKKNKYVFNK